MHFEALRFLDSLLRCGVATLFGLETWRRIRHLSDPRWQVIERYTEVWGPRGLGEPGPELLAWAIALGGGLGAVLLMIPRSAACGAMLLLMVAGTELASIWGAWWDPRTKVAFFLGAALVAITQSMLIRARSKQGTLDIPGLE